MKILEIRLTAFGPFTDTVLDFSQDLGGFHVVFGPNEAGKSSALRALQNMLFGIPLRSPDNFRHTHNRLRIGARLKHSNGKEIEFIRRKGQIRTLRDIDDESPMDEARLSEYLGGVSESLFSRMFGIGHEELIEGGREIISGGGDVGQALFAAGSGLIRLRNVQEKLDQESNDLFLPSGKKPRINKAVSGYREIRRSQKEAILPGKTWRSHDRALRKAQTRIDTVHRELTGLRQDCSRLERIGEAFPLISRRKEILTELADFGDVPVLSEDFVGKRRELETEFRIAGDDRDRVSETIRKVRNHIKMLPVPDDLLTDAAAIESLQQNLGSYRKAEADRPGLQIQMGTLQKEAANLLADIGDGLSIESARNLPLTHATIGSIQNLSKSYEHLTANIASARKSHRNLATRVKTLLKERAALAEPADISSLKAAMEQALGAGPVEDQLRETLKSAREIEQTIDRALKQQTLWSGVPAELESLPFPSSESIEAFDDKMSAAGNRMAQLISENAAAGKALTQINTDLKALELSQEVPSEEDLLAARLLRSKGWSLILQALNGEDTDTGEIHAFIKPFEGISLIPAAFEESISRADTIADRLRREAERVSRKGTLIAQREQQEIVLSKLQRDITGAKSESGALAERWYQQWAPAGIIPLSPKEMRAWANNIRSIQEKLTDLRIRKTGTEDREKMIDQLRLDVKTALTTAGETTEDGVSLSESIVRARSVIETQELLLGQIHAIDNELMTRSVEQTESDDHIADLTDGLADWKNEWEKAIAKIGLDAAIDPSIAGTIINSIRDVRTKVGEAETLQKRIDGIVRDANAFRHKVAELVGRVAPDLGVTPPTVAAAELNARLSDARASRSRSQALKEQLAKAEKENEAAGKRIADSSTHLDSLCREAGCNTIADLPDLEKRSSIRRQLESDLLGTEDRLRSLSAGATVSEFVADSQSVDADSIVPEIDALYKQIEILGQERSLLDQAIGTEKGELKRMDGSGKAAEYAEDAERLLAGMESDVEQYARLKIASSLLAGAIEKYREKNQGPLIRRAGELFSSMTLGAFQAIRAEYDDRGNPILVGIRPEAREVVRVEGMSDGSADQLYLALRLASLEQYLENNEPLPFTVDDILLRFDDDRAKATLQVMAALSEKTQVIFFTHHRHLVHLAESEPQVSRVLSVHALG